MKKILPFFLFAFFLSSQGALAVSVTINNSPSSVSSDLFNVDVSVLGASPGQNYLRVDLYKDGTTNYFGQTYNGLDWYGGSSGTSYFPITISDSKTTASASLQARIGSPTSSQFSGPGTYKLKIRRYTSSGSAASSDDISPIDLTINYSSPSTPTPSPKTSTPSPTSTPKSTSVKTPTPTKAPTQSKSLISSNSNNASSLSSGGKQTINNSDKIASDFARVRNPSPAQGKNGSVSVLGANKDESFWPFLIGGFLFLFIGLGILAMSNRDKIKIWTENL